MKMKAPGYRILVKLHIVEEVTKGGIILTEDYKNKLQAAVCIAEVIDLGPSCWWDVDNGKPWCKIGDRITINKYSYVDAFPDSKDEEDKLYKMINDKDVIGVYCE